MDFKLPSQVSGDLSTEDIEESKDSINEVYARGKQPNVLVSNKGHVRSLSMDSVDSESSEGIECPEPFFAMQLARDSLCTIVEEDSVCEWIFDEADECLVPEEAFSPSRNLVSFQVNCTVSAAFAHTMSDVKLRFRK